MPEREARRRVRVLAAQSPSPTVRFALRQGWTEDELTEVFLHLSGYIGVPIIRESMLLASRVFKEYRAETGKA